MIDYEQVDKSCSESTVFDRANRVFAVGLLSAIAQLVPTLAVAATFDAQLTSRGVLISSSPGAGTCSLSVDVSYLEGDVRTLRHIQVDDVIVPAAGGQIVSIKLPNVAGLRLETPVVSSCR